MSVYVSADNVPNRYRVRKPSSLAGSQIDKTMQGGEWLRIPGEQCRGLCACGIKVGGKTRVREVAVSGTARCSIRTLVHCIRQ
ncbi:hypothetical protein M3J09_011182 [Ascochyta lentis]